MANANRELIECIRAEIAGRGAISFAQFIELALYHPRLGYYASGRAAIGRRGDFFTNVSVGPIFGRLLAAQFAEVWRELSTTDAFQIVEQGAHDGTLAADVLSALQSACPEFYTALRYVIIEPFASWRERQREKLADFSRQVRWISSVEELQPFAGIHFSNELFDALPVHLVSRHGDAWDELCVVDRGDSFGFEPHPCRPELWPPVAHPHSGYRTEVGLAGPELMRQIARKLERGIILTVDYGFSRAEYYRARRGEGTLQARAHHRRLQSPFDQIGFADISAHVEWTSLAEASRLDVVGFVDQHHFIAGVITGLMSQTGIGALSASDQRGLQTLMHPEMLGRTFQVLGLGKNFTGKLSGLRFLGRDRL